ncbi:MAG: hypothetical protein GJ680_07810 [Alteromonadaceae bacterium]|nr:hypothetical protein [Alteromonadaceae bacterium]
MLIEEFAFTTLNLAPFLQSQEQGRATINPENWAQSTGTKQWFQRHTSDQADARVQAVRKAINTDECLRVGYHQLLGSSPFHRDGSDTRAGVMFLHIEGSPRFYIENGDQSQIVRVKAGHFYLFNDYHKHILFNDPDAVCEFITFDAQRKSAAA